MKALRAAWLAAVGSVLIGTAVAPIEADAQGASQGAAKDLSQWQEGRHYRRISPAVPTNVAPGKVEVVEIFWYGCSHCYTLDPFLERWKKNGKPEHVEFVRVPVTWNAGAKLHARLYYTLQALKQDERLHTKVFDTIFRTGNSLLGRDEAATLEIMVDWAKQNGVQEKAFRDSWNSMWVGTKLRQADDIVRRYRAEGTPFMAVNGRYSTDVGMAGGTQQMLNLINDLANAEKAR
jgi:thiol:disulfide interchange protein DsbA